MHSSTILSQPAVGGNAEAANTRVATELGAQLVPEFLVRDLGVSLVFYGSLGFTLERRAREFAVLRWGQAYLFLLETPSRPAHHAPPVTNIRVLVDDVDRLWHDLRERSLSVVSPIADRDYGLRDFTVRDPDGFAVRFASPIRS